MPRASRAIDAHRPQSFAEYREAFAGGGGYFFRQSADMVRWVNDKPPELIEVYLALRDRPEEFSRAAARSRRCPKKRTPARKIENVERNGFVWRLKR